MLGPRSLCCPTLSRIPPWSEGGLKGEESEESNVSGFGACDERDHGPFRRTLPGALPGGNTSNQWSRFSAFLRRPPASKISENSKDTEETMQFAMVKGADERKQGGQVDFDCVPAAKKCLGGRRLGIFWAHS